MIELIILDRDGVINIDSVEYIRTPNDWVPITNSIEAIAKLSKAGYKIVVVTNQSGISRGYFTHEELAKIHEKMIFEIEKLGGNIDGVFVCPHGPNDACSCRKPKPGLLFKVSSDFNIPREKIISVGDSLRDMQAAEAFGCKFALVLTGNGHYTIETNPDIDKDVVYKDLASFVDDFLNKKTNF